MRDIVKEINEKFDEIEAKENVHILHAIESGSRAWGFASPDSDYDVRFVYVRRKEDYLKLNEPRDVIEWQLDEVLDINGWDLKKALLQFARGNATLFEWCGSPIVYRTTESGNRKFNYGDDIEIFENWKCGSIEHIEGIPVLSLDGLIEMKQELGREKDLKDIVLIKDFLRRQ